MKTAAALTASPAALLQSTAAAMATEVKGDAPVALNGIFAAYTQAHDAINGLDDLPDHAPEWAVFDYWRTRFWTEPCRTLEDLRSKVRFAQSDTCLSDDIQSTCDIKFGQNTVASVSDVFLANILGETIEISHYLFDDLLADEARKLQQQEARKAERREEEKKAPKYRSVDDVPADLIPAELVEKLDAYEREIQALVKQIIDITHQRQKLSEPLLSSLNCAAERA